MKQPKSSRSQLFLEISSLKKFAILSRKLLCWGFFLIKLQAFRPATFLKRDSNTGVSCGYCEILKTDFLKKTSGGCFWQSYHSTVKSGGVFVLWFRAFTCFRVWLKTYAKRCTNNSLLSRDKTIFFLLKLIYHVLSEYVLEKQSLSILMKNLHKALHK